jgi:hypothetical protein
MGGGFGPLPFFMYARGERRAEPSESRIGEMTMTLDQLFDRLEDNNDHGLCAMLATVANRDYEGTVRIGEIIKIHLAQGSMPYDLCQERTKIMMRNIEELRAKGEMK